MKVIMDDMKAQSARDVQGGKDRICLAAVVYNTVYFL